MGAHKNNIIPSVSRLLLPANMMVLLAVGCLAMASPHPAAGYAPSAVRARSDPHVHQRRHALAKIILSAPVATLPFVPAANADDRSGDVGLLVEATEALSSLLDNWERATVDCTYADVPRDLLEAKNKEKLLEKASEFALFDKSTSIVSCKKSNRTVRDYIGATGKGPLVGADKRLLRKNVVDRLDPDSLDDYFSAAESFSESISRAKGLAYTAGTADFDSMNNFAKGEQKEDGTNLEQAREAIAEANTSLKRAVSLLIME